MEASCRMTSRPDPASTSSKRWRHCWKPAGSTACCAGLGDHPPVEVPANAQTRVGILLDVETTGLDPAQDEIIEIAILPFTYRLNGTVYAVGQPFNRLPQPSSPIPPTVTALTGLTDEMVAEHHIDAAEVARFIEPAALVIAHNASFDHKFAEIFCEAFVGKP